MNPKDFDIGILNEISKTSYSFFWVMALIGIGSIILARVNNSAYVSGLLNFSQSNNHKVFSLQSLSSPLLVFNYLISLTLFILIVTNSLSQSEISFSAIRGLKILIGVFIYHTLKTSIQYFVANLFLRKNRFDIRNSIRQYQIIGLILLPISIFCIYQSNDFQRIISILGIIITIVISITQIYNSAKESLHHKISLFYIILYLCTLEILPLFLLAKYFLS